MKKILVICHLESNRFDGQQSKTNDVISALKNKGYDVDILNYGHISRFSLLFKSCHAIKKHENILLMPGGKRALFLYTSLSKRFSKKNFYYLAVGGWVVDLINNKKSLKKLSNLKNFKCIALQNEDAVKKFVSVGFSNVMHIPTFSSKTPLSENEFKQSIIDFDQSNEFRFCFFARVDKTKGVIEACKAMKRVIEKYPNASFDIFGQIQNKDFAPELNQYLDDKIKYLGVLHDESIKILSSYYCMLFPTYYRGEGMAHSIIESFMAGLPVIATNWKFNSELVKEGNNGWLIDLNDLEDNLYNKVVFSIENKSKVKEMRLNCFNISSHFSSDKVLEPFIEMIDKK